MSKAIGAFFDPEFQHLKLMEIKRDGEKVSLVEIEPSTTKGFYPALAHLHYDRRIKITIRPGKSTHIWATPLCVRNPETEVWHTVYDAEYPDMIPGRFIYKLHYVERGLRSQCGELRERMMQEIVRMPPFPPFSSYVPPPGIDFSSAAAATGKQIPRFVGEAMKRDAIAAKQSCTISLEEFSDDKEALITPCFHIFSKEDLQNWLAVHASCPLCKGRVEGADCLSL